MNVSPNLDLDPLTNKIEQKAIADTGTTGHYLALDAPCLINVQPTTQPVRVSLPDDSIITSTHTADLEILQMLPPQARKGDLFPALKNTSLISIGMLADAGCKTTFDKDYCIVKHNNKEILRGNRCPYTKLWQISLKSPTNARKNLMEMSNNPQANALINKHSKI